MNPVIQKRLKDLLFIAVYPAVIFICSEWLLRNPFQEKWGIKPLLFITNLIFYYLLEYLFLSLTGSLRLSLAVLTVLSFVSGLADHYVYKFRGNTIVPWDFFSIGTALSVSSGYDYRPGRKEIILFLVFLVLTAGLFFCDYRITKKKKLRIKLFILSLFMLLFSYIPFVQSDRTVKTLRVYDKLFTPATMTMRDGIVFAFLYDLKFLSVKKPGDYNRDKIRSSLYNEYSGEEKNSIKTDENTPNIIVIMCEAFSDPGVLTGFNIDKDFMPFIRSLMEDEGTISGNLYVSVLGGNTPNTEFEFLTGNTMAFLPPGSIPFQQYINKKTDSLASYLKSIGYRTCAMHPYRASGWDRKRVYPLLGFDEMHFMEYFSERNPKYVRKYISDETLFREIIESYKENGSRIPLFSFNVTVQNHSEYSGDFEGIENDIDIEGLEGDYLIKRYLALESITDNAFKDLVSYFDSISDPTLIVFFGDHQPSDSVVYPLWALSGRDPGALSDAEVRSRYMVPYLIWANYDIKGEKGLDLSANFLGNRVLNAAGIELTGYRKYLEKAYSEHRIISAIQKRSPDGKDTDPDINDPSLQEYRRYQYYEIFDDDDKL